MPLDFPSSPTNGQYYNGFVYNAANETWDSAYAPRAATIPITSPNYIINGAFDIWQRGTTFTRGAGAGADYGSADRFKVGSFGAAPAVTLARSTDVPADLGIQYSAAMSWASSTSTGDVFLAHFIENGKFLFAGKTVTLSFYAKATNSITVGVAIDQDYGGSNITIGTSWTRYQLSWTLPTTYQSSRPSGSNASDNVELRLFRMANVSAAANTITFTGVQLEEGAAPTTFRRNAPSIQDELAACRRYFQVYGNSPVGNFTIQAGTGPSFSTTQSVHVMQFDTPLRTTPSITTSGSTNFSVDLVGVTSASSTAMLFDHMNENMTRIVVTHNSNGSMGLHKAVVLIANNTANARIYVNAEL